MAEPLRLRLFRSPDGFPLAFTAYVPEAMEPSADEASVHFRAAFTGAPDPDAFVHLFVFSPGTDRQTALAYAKGYKTGRGLPVSQGLEPVAAEDPPHGTGWALNAYRFRYQSGGEWFAGTLGVGRHGDRYFLLVRHRPVEYGDGFAPRADLILETWRWADGTALRTGRERDAPPPPGEAP